MHGLHWGAVYRPRYTLFTDNDAMQKGSQTPGPQANCGQRSSPKFIPQLDVNNDVYNIVAFDYFFFLFLCIINCFVCSLITNDYYTVVVSIGVNKNTFEFKALPLFLVLVLFNVTVLSALLQMASMKMFQIQFHTGFVPRNATNVKFAKYVPGFMHMDLL